jgi:hypothetical protein
LWGCFEFSIYLILSPKTPGFTQEFWISSRIIFKHLCASGNTHYNRPGDLLWAEKELHIPCRNQHRPPYTFGGWPSHLLFFGLDNPGIFGGHFETPFVGRILARRQSRQNPYRSLCILGFDLEKPFFHLLSGVLGQIFPGALGFTRDGENLGVLGTSKMIISQKGINCITRFFNSELSEEGGKVSP